MNNEDIIKLINKGESDTVELKRDLSSQQNILKTISAFLNTKGGYIIIGIEDNGEIRGLEIDNNTRTKLGNFIYTSIDPTPSIEITTYLINNKQLLVINVPSSNGEIYHFGTVPYKRIDTQDFPLKFRDADILRKLYENKFLVINKSYIIILISLLIISVVLGYIANVRERNQFNQKYYNSQTQPNR